MKKTRYKYIDGDYLSCGGRQCVVEGEVYKYLDKMKGNSTLNYNGKVFVDRYQLVDGKWKITINSLAITTEPIVFIMISFLLVVVSNYTTLMSVAKVIVSMISNIII